MSINGGRCGERFQIGFSNTLVSKDNPDRELSRRFIGPRFAVVTSAEPRPLSTIARCRAAAFTLTEVLVSVLLFSIAVAALCLTISFNLATTRSAQENLRASQILVEKMEYMRLYTWAQITNGTSIPKTFTEAFNPSSPNSDFVFNGQISIGPVWFNNNCSTNLRMVTVSVDWKSKRSESRRMQTFVSRNGLQQYVY